MLCPAVALSPPHLPDATADEPGPDARTPREREDERQRIEIGEPLGGEPVAVEDEAIDGLPGDGRSAGAAANGELDENAIGGGAPAVHFDGHVGDQLEELGEGAL